MITHFSYEYSKDFYYRLEREKAKVSAIPLLCYHNRLQKITNPSLSPAIAPVQVYAVGL